MEFKMTDTQRKNMILGLSRSTESKELEYLVDTADAFICMGSRFDSPLIPAESKILVDILTKDVSESESNSEAMKSILAMKTALAKVTTDNDSLLVSEGIALSLLIKCECDFTQLTDLDLSILFFTMGIIHKYQLKDEKKEKEKEKENMETKEKKNEEMEGAVLTPVVGASLFVGSMGAALSSMNDNLTMLLSAMENTPELNEEFAELIKDMDEIALDLQHNITAALVIVGKKMPMAISNILTE